MVTVEATKKRHKTATQIDQSHSQAIMGTTPSSPEATNSSFSCQVRQDPHQSAKWIRETLLDLVQSKRVEISYTRRLALYLSIEKDNGEQCRNILLEGITSSPTMPEADKDRLCDALLENRGDVASYFLKWKENKNASTDGNGQATQEESCGRQDISSEIGLVEVSVGNWFLDARRMALAIFRTSRKAQTSLPEESRQKVKHMILQTQDQDQLMNLLIQILERTCPEETRVRMLSDIAMGRYARLLLPDRFDCDEGRQNEDPRLTAITAGFASLASTDTGGRYDNMLVEGHGDPCPVCMDPMHAPVKLKSCHHSFCASCLQGWIHQHRQGPGSDIHNSSASVSKWDCPICRQEYPIATR